MTHHPQPSPCCREYLELSRRGFVGLAGTLIASIAMRPSAVLAQPDKMWIADGGVVENPGRDSLVVIFLRGGVDGLSVVPPFAENQYALTRPALAVPPPNPSNPLSAINLNDFFGLHPAMAALMPVYRAGHLLLVQACGFDDTSRSHFDSQKWMELGRTGDNSLRDGWLSRHLAGMGVVDLPIRAAAIGAGLPRSLLAAPRAYPFSDLNNLNLGGDSRTLEERLSVISAMYADADPGLATIGADSVAVLTDLNRIGVSGYIPAPGVAYSGTALGGSLRSVAALLKNRRTIEAVTIDVTGWDTHAFQGSQNPSGWMWKSMEDLGNNLAAFYFDMAQSYNPYSVVVMSEFGRNIRQNDSQGTDHGHGGIMMCMGRGIKGGRVLADWPGLNPANWFEGQDLPVTIDYRDILSEILLKRVGASSVAGTFPGFTPVLRDIARPI